VTKGPPDSLSSPETIRAQAEKILASKAFASSDQLSRFLRFTVDRALQGQGDQIKEYLVGVEVFGRGDAFDPRTDNVVRTQAGKLRTRLENYYKTDGLNDEVVIVYPKGTYVPVFERRQTPVPAEGERPRRTIPRWSVAGLVLLIAASFGVWKGLTSTGSTAPSIAVLPFVDMSPEKDQEYFCDGITEELINTLAKLEGVRVVARTSAFEFKGKGRDIRKIGAELNVRTVLEGSVRKYGTKLRVTAQLNDVKNGYHLWSETYDRELKDVFAIQEDISRAIVRVLRVKLGPDGTKPLATLPPRDPADYDLYLRGREHMNATTAESVKLALDCFEQVLAHEPAYAPAQAALAETYYWMAQRSVMPSKDAYLQTKAAAQKALAIDDRLAEAHSALAAALYGFDWDWPAADREFRRALELGPNDANVHATYSRYLTTMTRKDDALREIRRAEELDPLSIPVKQYEATLLWICRQFDPSIAQSRGILSLDPGYYMSYSQMGSAMLGAHRDREALEALWQGWTLSAHRDPVALTWLAYAVGATGDRAKAEELLRQMEDLSKQRYVKKIYRALVYAGLGDLDQAFIWLDRAYDERDVQISFLQLDYRADRLRSDPRFDALMKRMRLP
jgi:serine/threonine-protein kinase